MLINISKEQESRAVEHEGSCSEQLTEMYEEYNPVKMNADMASEDQEAPRLACNFRTH